MKHSEKNIADAMMSNDPILREKFINRELLKVSVQMRVTCGCGNILDCRTSVVAKHEGQAIVICEKCYEHFLEKYPVTTNRLEVINGKDLYE